MKKTEKQIAAEVEKLKKMKPTVLKKNYFGDSHHDAIDAQIEVLTSDMDDQDVYDRLDDGDYKQHVADAALEVIAWRDEDEEAPSETWKELVR